MFDTSRKFLNGKVNELQKQGLSKSKHRADSLTEEELLWSRHVPGADTALNLNLTVFYLISQQFDTCGCQKHHQLRVEHSLSTALVLVPLSMLKDLQKQSKQDLEKSIGGSHRGCLLHQIRGAQ